MKTNVSIKFNSIEEYREIEKKLEELGYKNRIYFSNSVISARSYIYLDCNGHFYPCFFNVDTKTYNSLEEFLKD